MKTSFFELDTQVFRVSYVLDSSKKLFQLHFLRNGTVQLFGYNRTHHALSTFTSYDKMPVWIKHGIDNEEVGEIVRELNYRKEKSLITKI